MFGAPQVAFADNSSYNDTVKELVRLNPGSTYSEMNNAIRVEATASKKTPQQVANVALKEARAHYSESAVNQYQTRSSSGSKATRKLQNAQRAGDIFYTTASTSGIQHGHAGIFTSPQWIIEAPGAGKTVWHKKATTVDVAKGGTQMMRVGTTQAKRNKAVARARTYLGRPYNYNFAFNKNEGKSMNCSQVVWAAYKYSVNIDLDGDNGKGVYPKDLTKAKSTVTYKTL